MFRSLKLYKGGYVDLESLVTTLINFEYKRQDNVSEEGDFSLRGNVIDIFPFTFELPIRIELGLENNIFSLKTFIPADGSLLWEHQIAIILPVKKTHTLKTAAFSEEFPLSSFVDVNIGDYVVHNQHGIGRFLGLEKVKDKDGFKDYLIIEYDRLEKLYVPIADMHLVQKYISF